MVPLDVDYRCIGVVAHQSIRVRVRLCVCIMSFVSRSFRRDSHSTEDSIPRIIVLNVFRHDCARRGGRRRRVLVVGANDNRGNR